MTHNEAINRAIIHLDAETHARTIERLEAVKMILRNYDKLCADRVRLEFFLEASGIDRAQIDAEMEDEKECQKCDGVGELPGNPHTNYFPRCSECGGSGRRG